MAPAAFRCCKHCLKLFGSASLTIHEARCREATRRRPPPRLAPPHACPEALGLVGCCRCGRTFAADRVARHERVCCARRREGQPEVRHEAAEKHKPPYTQSYEAAEKHKPPYTQSYEAHEARRGWHSSWRAKHLDFLRAVRAARGAPPPPPPPPPPPLPRRRRSPVDLLPMHRRRRAPRPYEHAAPPSPPRRTVVQLHQASRFHRSSDLYPSVTSAHLLLSADQQLHPSPHLHLSAHLHGSPCKPLHLPLAEQKPAAPRRPTAAQRHAALWAEQQQRLAPHQPRDTSARPHTAARLTPPPAAALLTPPRTAGHAAFAVATHAGPRLPTSASAWGSFVLQPPAAAAVWPSAGARRAGKPAGT